MPRSFDYEADGNKTDWEEVRLAEPRYGRYEITIEDVNALTAATGTLGYSFSPQFSTHGKPYPENRAEAMDAAHAWLSENMTGPWFWHENWTNHGHHIETYIYIERETDQRFFLENFAHQFTFHQASPHQLYEQAVLRGALPLPNAEEHFRVWEDKNSGYILEDIDAEAKPQIIRMSFTIPAIEQRFLADWGDVFKRDDSTSPPSYVGPWIVGPGYGQRDFGVWLSRHSATGEMQYAKGQWTLQARHLETALALAKAWGHMWEMQPVKFVASEPGSSLPISAAGLRFLDWKHLHDGFDFVEIDDDRVRFTFSNPALEKKFITEWGQYFDIDDSLSPTTYTGPWVTIGRGRNKKDLAVWLSKHSGIGNIGGQGEAWTFEARYPETVAAVIKDWDGYWEPTQATFTFTTKHYTPMVEPEVPQDYIAYLKGEREDYAAPYAGALIAKRDASTGIGGNGHEEVLAIGG